jgi:hypothetical protein
LSNIQNQLDENNPQIVITGKKVVKRKGVEIEMMTKSRRVYQKNSQRRNPNTGVFE